ncbi:MAG: TetR/AcrR family transcriptional regulator [Actinobacteria bacterium]|nr:TetR/AcrR family transcriptional regulator [Actinomycetota bacterium]
MLPSMAPSRSPGRPLSADDWIQTGFALLTSGGPDALRIGRLCERLDVTKGSFYWHFSDIQTYRAALVDAWGDLRDRDRRRLVDVHIPDPRERLAAILGAVAAPEHVALERVMRTWAMTDDHVASNVRQSDERLLSAIREAISEFGFDTEQTRLRATVTMASGIGLLYMVGAALNVPPELLDRFLDFVLRP